MSDLKEIDLVNRDPNGINGYLLDDFQEMFGEPDATHSMDCVWRNSYKCFMCSKSLCYKLLTFFTGIFIAFGWGCAFAYISFGIIWCVGPLLKALSIILLPTKRILQMFLSAIVGPCVEVHSLIFSRIHVTQAQGQPNKPFGELEK